eukprot:366417-Chlamydomonas_euryale.AAC.18
MSNFIPSKPAPRPGAPGTHARPGHVETPRDFEDELTEEELLRLELEKVKHERMMLMQSIASAKAQSGKQQSNFGVVRQQIRALLVWQGRFCEVGALTRYVPFLAGTAGGEAQQNDIKQLRKELELKKAKLNELSEETRRKEKSLDRQRDENTDAVRMTPAAMSEENDYIANLKDEMKRIDEDLTEAEAKNRLYYLLGERTRCVDAGLHAHGRGCA